MSQEPDPQQPEPDQPPYGQQPSAWPDQQPPTDPPPGPQPMPAQGQPPKRKTFGWLALSLATVGGLIVGGIAGSLGASGFGGTADGISDGEYEIGVDIDPGRYKTVTPAEDNGSFCLAEVYAGDDTLESEVTYSGPSIVDIPNKMGAIFQSFDCGEWRKIG